MGNNNKLSQTAPIPEIDSDSESDMPDLIDEEQVSQQFGGLVDVDPHFVPDQTPLGHNVAQKNVQGVRPLPENAVSNFLTGIHRWLAVRFLSVMLIYSTSPPRTSF